MFLKPTMEPVSPLMAENLGDASCISIKERVLNATPAHPASKALAHISYVLPTTEEERRNGFSIFIPHISLSRSFSSDRSISGT